jgi:hypothetical protein
MSDFVELIGLFLLLNFEDMLFLFLLPNQNIKMYKIAFSIITKKMFYIIKI